MSSNSLLETRIATVVNADDLSDRVANLRSSIARLTGSDSLAQLLAASKTRSPAEIRRVVELGILHIGENRLQEAKPKIAALRDLPIQWHFIGRIQANKTTSIASMFDWVDTVDRLRIATRLSTARLETATKPLNVCIQVNIDNEPQKGGIPVEEASSLVNAVEELPGLRLRGLMCLPQARPNPEAIRPSFRRLKSLFDELAGANLAAWDTLSMGMSADYQVALEEGATQVRLGTAIFGPRN